MQNLSRIVLMICVCGLLTLAHAETEKTPPSADATKQAKATFAGGCFWCMEPPFDKLNGVISTTSGYIGGLTLNPTYKEVSAGKTGHAEAVEIVFDPTQISYAELLEVFWRNIDPMTPNRQFCDTGSQYRSAIFYHDDEQKRLAEASKQALEQSGQLPRPIVTEIVPATKFYVAEEYHQDYYQKNPLRYKFYRYSCGRDQILEQIWGKSTG
jgi:peptide-methionine (S)-S-oxide reductase